MKDINVRIWSLLGLSSMTWTETLLIVLMTVLNIHPCKDNYMNSISHKFILCWALFSNNQQVRQSINTLALLCIIINWVSDIHASWFFFFFSGLIWCFPDQFWTFISLTISCMKHYQIESNIVRCPNPEYAEKMINAIDVVRVRGDSVGGVVTCIVRRCPRVRTLRSEERRVGKEC